jgi:hypothetical protein
VWSAAVITRWSQKTEVCCKPCGNAAKWKAAALSGLFGWWGFPWGFIVTPAQIIRNLGYMIKGPDPTRPSEKLVGVVRTNLSSRLLREEQQAQAVTAANSAQRAG